MRTPKLRTVEKYKPPYPLNSFPSDVSLALILKQPPALSRETVLAGLNFNPNWVQVLGTRSTLMPDD